MFCDIVESTALSRRIDPEEYGECMLSYQQLGQEAVERHGGYVANYLGDGLLAFFGWPTSHERDADLAIRASRELLSELVDLSADFQHRFGIEMTARVGIHSGLAMVGMLGEGRRDASVFGDAANVASRVQGLAPPGRIAITGETKRLLRERWDLQNIGRPPLKGVGTELEVLLVGAPEALSGPDVERIYPMVNREGELGQLRSIWRQVESGSGAIVALEGEAGVGKSRLCYEFMEAIGHVPWLTVQCSPMTTHVPFAPFLSTRLPPLASEGRSPEERRAHQMESMRGWVLRLSAEGPGVLHVEDAHWADPSTGELLERMADEVDLRSLLIMCTVRPTDGHRWLSHPAVQKVRLGSLSGAEIRSLVAAAAEEVLTSSTIDDITARADGLPLFAEQLAAAMVGAPDSELPVTLHASLMARLDQLGPDTRTLLQRGAAIGRDFDDGLLTALVTSDPELPESLDRLVGAGILAPAGEGRHKFRHALLQEAAHESMLRSERRTVHSRIASILDDQFRSLVESDPARMAFHLEEARDQRAVIWLERAGTQAAESAAYAEASGYFDRALTLLDLDDGATELGLRIKLGNAMFGALGYAAAESLPVWRRAAELARTTGNVLELTSALNGEATYWNQVGSCRRSVDIAEEILRVAEEHDLRIGRLRAHCTIALNHLFLGNASVAREHALKAVPLYRTGDYQEVTYGFGTDQGVVAYGVGGAASWMNGYLDEGTELTAEAVRHACSLGSPISELLARLFKGFIHHMSGDHDAAMYEARVLVNEGTRLRLPFSEGFGHLLLGAERAIVTEDPDGVAEVLTGMDQLAMAGGQNGAPLAFMLLAEAQLAIGETGAAFESATGGLELAEVVDQHFFDSELLRLQAKANAGVATQEETAELLRAGLNGAVARGQFVLALRAGCDLADSGFEREPVVPLSLLLERIVGGMSSGDRLRAESIVDRARS